MPLTTAMTTTARTEEAEEVVSDGWGGVVGWMGCEGGGEWAGWEVV